VLDELLEELLQRRDADAHDPIGRPARDELRRVAREHDRALLPGLHRAVGRDVERNRRSSRVGRAGDSEIEDLHDISVRPRPRSGKRTVRFSGGTLRLRARAA